MWLMFGKFAFLIYRVRQFLTAILALQWRNPCTTTCQSNRASIIFRLRWERFFAEIFVLFVLSCRGLDARDQSGFRTESKWHIELSQEVLQQVCNVLCSLVALAFGIAAIKCKGECSKWSNQKERNLQRRSSEQLHPRFHLCHHQLRRGEANIKFRCCIEFQISQTDLRGEIWDFPSGPHRRHYRCTIRFVSDNFNVVVKVLFRCLFFLALYSLQRMRLLLF